MNISLSPLVAVALSVLIGHVITSWLFLNALRAWARHKKLLVDDGGDELAFLITLIGFAERGAVTILMVVAPNLVPAFIGAWIALKYLPGWDRFNGGNTNVRTHYAITLLGNFVSFTCALIAGYLANPSALTELAG